MSHPKSSQPQSLGKWRALLSLGDVLLDRPVRRWLRARSREPGIKQSHRGRRWPPAHGLTARPAI
jgi:hypothetical protein